MLEGITALGNRLNCLCVKSKGEEGQAGDRELIKKKKQETKLLWAPADCKAISSQWWPFVIPGGPCWPISK